MRNTDANSLAMIALILLCSVLGMMQGPPPGHPFALTRQQTELAAVLDQLHSWGLSDMDSLALIAWALQVPAWTYQQGVSPILQRWP